MIGWHETSCVHLDDNTVARFCALDPKPFSQGLIADLHKGRLFLPFEERKVVVRAFSGLPLAEAGSESRAELEKQKLAGNVLKAFPEELGNSIRLVPKFPANVRRVSVPHKFLACTHVMEKGCPVLIQDRITHQTIQDLSRPWTRTKPADPRAGTSQSHPLLSLAQKSLAVSRGSYVIIGTRGVITSAAERKKGIAGGGKYFLTSLVVHSTGRSFGLTDEGPAGIQRFLEDSGLKWTGGEDLKLPPHLPRLEPSAPALEDVVECDPFGRREEENAEKESCRMTTRKEAEIRSMNISIEFQGPVMVNVLSQSPPSYVNVVGTQAGFRPEEPPPYSSLPPMQI